GFELIQKHTDDFIAAINDIGYLSRLAVTPQESRSVFVAHTGRTFQCLHVLWCIFWRFSGHRLPPVQNPLRLQDGTVRQACCTLTPERSSSGLVQAAATC